MVYHREPLLVMIYRNNSDINIDRLVIEFVGDTKIAGVVISEENGHWI